MATAEITAKKGSTVILGALLAALVATMLMAAFPQQAEAKALKTTGSYSFTSPMAAGASENCAAITPKSKKLTIKGMGYYYKGATFKTLAYKTYTAKPNGKTKYYNQSAKISKKKAFSTLKGMNYIAVHLEVKNGLVKRFWFGA